MSTSHTAMKGDRPEIYSIGDLPDKSDILERPLEIPSSFDSGPTIINSRFAVPAYQGEGSIDPEIPDTLKRPKDTFFSFGKMTTIHNSNFTTTIIPPTSTSEITQYTPAGELDPDSHRRPNDTFIQFDQNAVVHNSTFSQFGANSQVFMFPSAQALPNGSVTSPIRGFHAWNDSEKIKALTAVHSLQTVIQAVVRAHKSNNDDDGKSLRASLSSYMEFVDYLVESRLPERARSLQDRAICLVVLAGVAIFLGVAQLLALILLAGLGVIPTGRQLNHSNLLGNLINLFAFCGISLDVLAAMFALWTFFSLILMVSKIERIVLEKQNLNAKIHSTLDAFREAASSSPQQEKTETKARATRDISSKNLVNLFANFQQSSAEHHREARALVHLIDDHLTVREEVITLGIIALGLLGFFASLLSFILSTLPWLVGSLITIVVTITFVFLFLRLGHQRPGSWRSTMWSVRTTITACFPLRNTRASGGDVDDDV